ncbi:MAG: FKBP-type peptidyl-prolyl cis-trans isomerase [Parcubacteria group bacterium]|nr:FKBP-type peptidyl-prolyl cis-trans isomerase [Parcubacteria group bacterium]
MRKRTQNEYIAVAIGIAVIGFLLFGSSFWGLFTSSDSITATTTTMNIPASGVHTEDIVIGTGATAVPGDTVTVNYVGTLTDGKVFDSSYDRKQPLSFVLGAGQVIRGWDEGFKGMRVGGKRRLIIAPDYGYGNQNIGPIPANSTLVFDVELLDVSKTAVNQ